MPDRPDDLLSEVFSPARLQILQSLDAGALKFTQVASRLETSESEVSRNLGRLLDAGLVAKEPGGAFALTSSARLLLAHVPALAFVAQELEFFNAHAATGLPSELARRLDALGKARLARDPFTIYGHLERMLTTVDSHFEGQWIVGQGLSRPQLALHETAKRRLRETSARARTVMLRSEFPTMLRQSPDFLDVFETRIIDAAVTSVATSERAAIVWFEDLSGRIDFNSAFVGEDPGFLRWALDLFEWHWARAEPVASDDAKSALRSIRHR